MKFFQHKYMVSEPLFSRLAEMALALKFPLNMDLVACETLGATFFFGVFNSQQDSFQQNAQNGHYTWNGKTGFP